MRPIKFRARNADVPACWIFGYYVVEGELCFIINSDGKYQVRADSICEFTGLHDKNGKEIWEGDIVRVRCGGAELNDKIVSIVFEDAAFRDSYYHWQMLRKSDPCYEVLGNIYENPELLK